MEDKISIIQNFNFADCFYKEKLLDILKIVSPDYDTSFMKRIYLKKLDAEIKRNCDNEDKIEYLLKIISEYKERREIQERFMRMVKASLLIDY